MQNVTIIKHNGHPIEIPISNLETTLRILGANVKKVDYGTVKVASPPPKAKKKRASKKKKK